MLEKVGQSVSVLASFSESSGSVVKVTPLVLKWRGKSYKVEKFGLYHPERRGDKRFHIFSFSSGQTSFRVELDPETLEWILAEVYYE